MANQTRNALKRHCMVVHAYYPIGETRVERQALALIAQGYDVDIICLKGSRSPAFSNENGANVYRIPMSRQVGQNALGQLFEYLAFFWHAMLLLTRLHLRRRYSVVQLHNLPDFLVFAGIVPKLLGAKLILDIHDVMPEFYAARFGTTMDSWAVRLVTWQEQISCWFADQVITVTDLWRHTLADRGTPLEKIAVVMNSADSQIFHRVEEDSLPPKTDNNFKLIYHGNLSPRYGLDLTIRAMDVVRREEKNVQFIIHGGGRLWAHQLELLNQLVDELDMREHIKFSSNFVPTSELPMLIRQADAGVVSYRRDVFTDGILPTKVLEYVALGMPVVAAKSPVLAVYFDDDMLQYFEPESVEDQARVILALVRDKQRQQKLVESSGRFLDKYGWEKMSQQYVALVDQLRQS